MPVRTSMQYVITFVRELVNDTSATPQYTDQQIQDRLDLNRLDLYQDCLKAADTLTASGTIEWHDFHSRYPFWETDFVIKQPDGDVVTSNTPEPLIGKFSFTAHQSEIPLSITGRVYNVYGVAATLVTMMIADIRNQVTSWTADGTTIQRLNQLKNLEDLAKIYSQKAWGWGNYNQIKLVRKDLRN